jgi:BirA family biotin operon repressor/biotin-[acetyl-CoA-carboxylase] ligase
MLEGRILEIFKSKNVSYIETLPSTQSYALNLLSKNKPKEKTAILTYNQTQGKGQLGAQWLSEVGQNICISIILYPNFLKIQNQFQLSKVVALALANLVKSKIGDDVFIKWPNDIIINRKKIAGILINNSIQGNVLGNSVVGIGLNVNQKAFDQGLQNATSLWLESSKNFELEMIVIELIKRLSYYYDLLKKNKNTQINKEYKSLLFGLDHELSYTLSDSSKIIGKFVGVDLDGRMQLETNTGVKLFDIKEIKFDL